MLKFFPKSLMVMLSFLIFGCMGAFAQHQVTGKVVDEQNLGMPGVSIKIVGTSSGVITDLDGNYKVDLPKGKEVLTFSFIGFKTQTVNVKGRSVVNVTLVESSKSLQEVVVVGMGTQKRNTITASVSTVNAEAIKNRPVTDVTSVLQGNVAGLNISSAATESGTSGGELGGDIKFNIRGIGSINGGEPYVLVDGVEQSLQNVNPADIESITVLKDASAAAIYGSRAAYGVVLVTTKSGKKGSFKISYNGSFGASSPINMPEMMNSLEFAHYKNAYQAAIGQKPSFSEKDIALMEAFLQDPYSAENPGIAINEQQNTFIGQPQYANTDWFKYHFKNASFRQDHNLNISGGSEKTRYYIGLGVNSQNGLMADVDDKLTKYSMNSKIQITPSKWLNIDLTNNLTYIDIKRPLPNMSIVYHNIARTEPNRVTHLPVDNEYNIPGWNSNLYLRQVHFNEDRISDALSLGLTVTPLEGWKIMGQMSGRFNFNMNEFEKGQPYISRPNGLIEPYTQALQGYSPSGVHFTKFNWNSYSRYNAYDFYLSPNLMTSFTRQFGDHFLKVMAGFQAEYDKFSFLSGYKTDVMSESTFSFRNANGLPNVDEDRTHWTTMGYYSRINWNYKNTYFVEFSGRYDGSSRFAPHHRWGLFPSMSTGVDFAQMKFFEKWKLPISQFKLRASYGRLGNQSGVGLYQYYSFVRLIQNAGNAWLLPGVNKDPTAGILAKAPDMASVSLTWEKVDTGDLGLDITAFDDRLSFTADIYQRNTRDMVGPAETIPSIAGLPESARPKLNNANLRTRGWELSVQWKDRFKNGFHYSIGANISDYKSVITKYNNPDGIIRNNHTGLRRNMGYYEGMDIGEIWGYQADDLFLTNNEVDEYLQQVDLSYFKQPEQWQRGDLKYIDSNGDGKVNPGKGTLNDHGDLKIIGNATPRYSIGINMSVGYKGFEVSALWQGVCKRDFPISASTYMFNGNENFFKDHLDYFSVERPGGFLPRLTAKGSTDYNVNAGYNTTRYLLDASYMRLKNLMVSYTFSPKLVKKIGLTGLKLYLSGDNLLTFDNLPHAFDPETLNQVNTWAGGSNEVAPGLTSPMNQNGNGKVYPLNRNYVFGINLSF